MEKIEKGRIILDANIALHFQQADQINWHEVVDAKEIFLVITPTLIRELEKQKIQHPSYKLRKRAQRYISWLLSLLEKETSPQIREHVWLEFIAYEPQIDLQRHRLSSSVEDDQYIAHALEYMENSNTRIGIATADSGLIMKLRSRNMDCVILPDKFRLSAEPDPIEQENAQLKQQLAEFKSRLPQLKLCFADNRNRLEFTLSHPEPIETFMSERINAIKAKHPEMSIQDDVMLAERIIIQKDSGFGSTRVINLTDRKRKELVEAYNQKLGLYYKEYEKYLHGWWQYHEQSSLKFTISLLLINDGTSPAHDIDIRLKFPETVEIYDRDSFWKTPTDEPTPPIRPGRINMENHKILAPMISTHLPSQDTDKLVINPNARQIEFWVKNLKHNRSHTLKAFSIYFRTRDEIENFACDYQMYITEISAPLTGKLHFVAK